MARKRTPPKARKATRLPSGSYSWRGRAVPFSKLPKAERSRFRGSWARKAAKTQAKERTIERREPSAKAKERKAARGWIKRRSERTGVEDPGILAQLGPKAVLAARELQRSAHAAYKRQGSVPGGRAFKVADQIRESLGAELAAIMPQLWWYH